MFTQERKFLILIVVIMTFLAVSLIVYTTDITTQKDKVSVDFKKVEEFHPEDIPKETGGIRIVIGSMVTPTAGFAYYKQLLNYIETKMQQPVQFLTRNSYKETSDLLKYNKAELGFFCGRPYVDGHDDFGLELLVAPRVDGKTTYQSYTIVHKDSSAENFEDLQGKVFAFADPLSNSGKLVPTYKLAKMGHIPETFFKRYFYTYAHDKVIKAVAQKIADGGAVDSLIYDYEKQFNPVFTSQTKIIDKSPHYGIPPVVVPRGLDPELKKDLKAILLSIHEDPKGKEILKGMRIERFVEVDDSAYDGIRRMRHIVERK